MSRQLAFAALVMVTLAGISTLVFMERCTDVEYTSSVAVPAAMPPTGVEEECKMLWRRKVHAYALQRDARREAAARRLAKRSLDRFSITAFDPYGERSSRLQPSLLPRRRVAATATVVQWVGVLAVMCACVVLLSEPDWSCEARTREGVVGDNSADTPRWVCGLEVIPYEDCLLMSLGVAPGVVFESAIYRARRCETHVFDPTADGAIAPELKAEANGTLHVLGLGKKGGSMVFNGKTVNTYDLPTLLQKSGLGQRRVDVLKVDFGSLFARSVTCLPVLASACQCASV
jgi:hypothetical protein